MKRTIKRNFSADEILLLEAFEDFIDAKEAQNLSPATIRNYKQSNNFFFTYFEVNEETPVSIIEEKLIFQWINHMKKEDLSINAINHYLRDTRTFFYWMMERDYIEPFKIKLLEVQEEMPKHFTDEELVLLLEKPSKKAGFTEWRTYTIICFILATGARPSTICDIRVNDIDFSRKEIVYRHLKTKQAMVVPLSDALATTLKLYIRMWRQGGEYLFCNVGDEKLTTNALRLSFQRYCKSRDVNKTNIYGLRHSFARGWIKNNGNTFALQKMLGHSDIAMTKHYVKLYAEDLKEGLEDFTVLDNMTKAKKRTKKVERSF